MSEGKGKRKWPIPHGFTWDHVANTYVNGLGNHWNSEINLIYDPRFFNPDGTPIDSTIEKVEAGGAAPPVMVDSASDARTANNGNIMRHNYRVLSDAEKTTMTMLKDLGVQFTLACDSIGASRELSLAKTKMEEAVMWAVKHVTK